MDIKQAMESAKRSYKEDIKAGYKILHIDPSIDLNKKSDADEILNRVFELYSYCLESSKIKS